MTKITLKSKALLTGKKKNGKRRYVLVGLTGTYIYSISKANYCSQYSRYLTSRYLA